MKAKKTTELVEVEYWACSVPTHRHRTKAVAEACIAKHSGPKRVVRRWTTDEMADAFVAVLGGATLKEVGQKYDISHERMRQIIHKVRRMAMHPSRLTEPTPEHDWTSLEGMREHSDFWRRQIAKIRKRQSNGLAKRQP